MSLSDWVSCPECDDGGDPEFGETIDAQKRVIKCGDCGYSEFVKFGPL